MALEPASRKPAQESKHEAPHCLGDTGFENDQKGVWIPREGFECQLQYGENEKDPNKPCVIVLIAHDWN